MFFHHTTYPKSVFFYYHTNTRCWYVRVQLHFFHSIMYIWKIALLGTLFPPGLLVLWPVGTNHIKIFLFTFVLAFHLIPGTFQLAGVNLQCSTVQYCPLKIKHIISIVTGGDECPILYIYKWKFTLEGVSLKCFFVGCMLYALNHFRRWSWLGCLKHCN